jgi:Sensors of blue-light using FAD
VVKTPSLIRICYISESRLPSGPDFADGIAAILRRSIAWNESVGITGALFFNRAIFGQVLEGPMAAVEHIFDRIRRDPRHDAIIRLDWRAIERRDFTDWAMCFVGADPDDSRRFGELQGDCPEEAVLARDQLFRLLITIVAERERAGTVSDQARLRTAHAALHAARATRDGDEAQLDAVTPPA